MKMFPQSWCAWMGALQGTFCTVKTILALLTVAWGRKGPAAFPGTAFGVWEEMMLIHQVNSLKFEGFLLFSLRFVGWCLVWGFVLFCFVFLMLVSCQLFVRAAQLVRAGC